MKTVYDMPDADYQKLELDAERSFCEAYPATAKQASDEAGPARDRLAYVAGEMQEAYTDGYRTGYLVALSKNRTLQNVKVFAVYSRDGYLILVEGNEWTDESAQRELAKRSRGHLRTFNVQPFYWAPKVPRVLPGGE